MGSTTKLAWIGLVMAFLLGESLCFLLPPHAMGQPATPISGQSAEMSKAAGRLIMVHIRTASDDALKKLRTMPMDIIRVRPAANSTIRVEDLIVEAVIPLDLLPKLEALGFDVKKVPPR